ncbi:hypothetical protein ALC60_12904 [Trachymyrmex zeteki]|uniref:Uncharacterized protein n=1 Tax=Mycetomoellerius zeteki TaxID=64791 RepID=A0A151WJR7_9HYME|nr:hypothetical protein ALC60_12904 [Trachymyrmex zeteki]
MEEIDARPDIIPVAKVTPPLREGSDRSDSRCFSSFPPGPFHRSCYHMDGLREQNNNMQRSRLSNERLVCSVNCLSSGNLIPAACAM